MNLSYNHRTKLSLWREIKLLRKKINTIEQKHYNFENVFEAAIGVVLKNFPAQTRENLIGPRRYADIVYPRHITMYLLKNYTDRSLSQIGHFMGHRDHSTVLHAGQVISDYIITDKRKREHLAQIVEEFQIALENTQP